MAIEKLLNRLHRCFRRVHENVVYPAFMLLHQQSSIVRHRISYSFSLLCFALLCGTVAADTAVNVDSRLPAYQPRPASPAKNAGYLLRDGSIRIVGFDDMEGIITGLNDLYIRSHPGVRFTFTKGNSLAAIYALTFDSSAFAPMGMEFSGSLPYSDTVHGPPFSIRIAHASLNRGAKLSPLAVIVNKNNPIENLTVGQITSIFTQSMRKRVISHWSQLGVSGEVGTLEIHPCGLPWSDHYPSEEPAFGDFMFLRKMGGGQPVRNYAMLATYAGVIRKVQDDSAAIGLSSFNQLTTGVRLVGVIGNEFGRPSRPTADEIIAGKYPFDRYLYVYGRLVSGRPLDPFVSEYMRMILSREGQEIIAREAHGYLPLNAVEAGEELAKLQ